MDSKVVLIDTFREMGLMPPTQLDTASQFERDIQRASDIATDKLAVTADYDEDALIELRKRTDELLIDEREFLLDCGDILLNGDDRVLRIQSMLRKVVYLDRENDNCNNPVINDLYRKIGLSLHQSLINYATPKVKPTLPEAFPDLDDTAQGIMGLSIGEGE